MGTANDKSYDATHDTTHDNLEDDTHQGIRQVSHQDSTPSQRYYQIPTKSSLPLFHHDISES